MLTNKSIPIRARGHVYEACSGSVLMFGGETWALTENVKNILIRGDRRMLRYMAGVTWRDGLSSAEVATRCGLKKIDVLFYKARLRWFGHIKRREDNDALARIGRVEVPGRRPPGRPMKAWRKNMEEELRSLRVQRDEALDVTRWRTIIDNLTS